MSTKPPTRYWQDTTHPVVSSLLLLYGAVCMLLAIGIGDFSTFQRVLLGNMGLVVSILGIYMLLERRKLKRQQTIPPDNQPAP